MNVLNELISCVNTIILRYMIVFENMLRKGWKEEAERDLQLLGVRRL